QGEAPGRIAETSEEFDALCELERAAAAVDLNPTAAALDQYYEAQRRLRVALATRPAPPCTESAGPARSALAHHGFRHARKPARARGVFDRGERRRSGQ